MERKKKFYEFFIENLIVATAQDFYLHKVNLFMSIKTDIQYQEMGEILSPNLY